MSGQLRDRREGLIIAGISLLLLAASLLIPSNPVKTEGLAGVLIQARTVPVFLSAALLIQGLRLSLHPLSDARHESNGQLGLWLPILTTAYLLAVYLFGFLIPTLVFLAAIILLLAGREYPLWMLLLLAGLYTAVSLWLIPLLLDLNLRLT